jgi:hypothetical protein
MLTFCWLCLCLMPCHRTFHQDHALPLFRSIYTWLSVVTFFGQSTTYASSPRVISPLNVCRISTLLASVTFTVQISFGWKSRVPSIGMGQFSDATWLTGELNNNCSPRMASMVVIKSKASNRVWAWKFFRFWLAKRSRNAGWMHTQEQFLHVGMIPMVFPTV